MPFWSKTPPPDRRTDPQYDHMVGRIVEAAEMLSHYNMLHGDDKARGMAGRVQAVLSYFIPEDERLNQHSNLSEDAETLVRPPRASD